MPAPFSPEITQPQNKPTEPVGQAKEARGVNVSGQEQSSQAQTSQSQPSSYPPEQNENLPDQIKPKHSSFWQGRWAKILLVVGLTLAIIILGGAIIFALVGGNFSGLSGYVKNIPGWEVLFGRQTKTVQIDDSIVNTPSERASLLAGSSLADFPFERLQPPLRPAGDCHFFTFHICPFEVEAVAASGGDRLPLQLIFSQQPAKEGTEVSQQQKQVWASLLYGAPDQLRQDIGDQFGIDDYVQFVSQVNQQSLETWFNPLFIRHYFSSLHNTNLLGNLISNRSYLNLDLFFDELEIAHWTFRNQTESREPLIKVVQDLNISTGNKTLVYHALDYFQAYRQLSFLTSDATVGESYQRLLQFWTSRQWVLRQSDQPLSPQQFIQNNLQPQLAICQANSAWICTPVNPNLNINTFQDVDLSSLPSSQNLEELPFQLPGQQPESDVADLVDDQASQLSDATDESALSTQNTQATQTAPVNTSFKPTADLLCQPFPSLDQVCPDGLLGW